MFMAPPVQYDWPRDEWVSPSEDHPAPVPGLDGGDSGGECGVVTSRQLPLPLWYSVNVGSIHVIAMCTEVDFTVGSAQWTWLEQDLARLDRRAYPWVLTSPISPPTYLTGCI